jgi:hypothetical protein
MATTGRRIAAWSQQSHNWVWIRGRQQAEAEAEAQPPPAHSTTKRQMMIFSVLFLVAYSAALFIDEKSDLNNAVSAAIDALNNRGVLA